MEIILGLIIIVFSAILHEVAHGWVADRLGDPTARLSGRLTLDPRPHIDPFMTIIVPLLLIVSGSPIIFGGAKPVPVDPFNLRDGRKDLALVSLAGPVTNIILAIIGSLCLHFLPVSGILGTIFQLIVSYNVLLAIFNLIPIPPLDGSKIVSLLLPEQEAAAYMALGQFGLFIIFALLVFPIGGFSLQHVIGTIYAFALNLLGL